jgi:glycosyltransferase involved in cell wall biosynthesis
MPDNVHLNHINLVRTGMKRLLIQHSETQARANDTKRQGFEKYALWIGPHFDSKGGVASVIKTFKEEGFFTGGQNRFIPTMEDGSKLYKLLVFFKAFFLFTLQIRHAKLVHVHLCGKASFWRKSIFMFTANLFSVPVITHMHDSGFALFYASVSGFKKQIIHKALASSDKLFVLSVEIQEFFRKLPLGIEPELFPNPIVLKTNIPPVNRSEQTTLFLGRIVPEKGIQELLEAIAIVKTIIPAVHLIIGGDGDMNWLHKLIMKHGLKDSITIKGWVGDQERQSLMRSSTMLVLPSYGEGQSISILEAMESFLPVISTTVGGNTFLIDNGTSGLLVPPKDANALASAIILILNDPTLKLEMVQAARQRVEVLFDSKKVVSKVRDLYSSY